MLIVVVHLLVASESFEKSYRLRETALATNDWKLSFEEKGGRQTVARPHSKVRSVISLIRRDRIVL